MRIDLLVLSLDMCETVVAESVVNQARKKGALQVCCHQIRNHTYGKHSRVDGCPFGGGMGMPLMAEPIAERTDDLVCHLGKRPCLIYMSPRGIILTQKKMKELAERENLAILYGHYEGIDERITNRHVDEQTSAGDYALTNSELLTLTLADGISRLIPGVLSDSSCFEEENHFSGLLKYPQYMRPANWRDLQASEVLLSRHYTNIDKWCREQSSLRTWKNHSDLLEAADLDEKDKRYLATLCEKKRDFLTNEPKQNAQYRMFAVGMLEDTKVLDNRGKLYKGIVCPKQRIGHRSKVNLPSLTAFFIMI